MTSVLFTDFSQGLTRTQFVTSVRVRVRDECVYTFVMCLCEYTCMHTCMMCVCTAYEVAMISRLLRIIGLFYKRALQKRPIFYKRDLYYTCMMCVCTTYGVAMISRLLKIMCLFCKRALQKRLYSAKETYNFVAPTCAIHVACHACYEVATISRLLKNYMSLLQNIVFYDFKEPTNRSHLIMAVDVS